MMHILQYDPQRDHDLLYAMMSEHDMYRMDRYIDQHSEHISVAYQGNLLVGCVAFDGIKRIANTILYVQPAYRQRGIGTKLIQHVESIFEQYDRIEQERFQRVGDQCGDV